MAKKTNKINKKINKKNNKKKCSCKEKFHEDPKPASSTVATPATAEASSFTFSKFDDGLSDFFGSSKFVTSTSEYNLKDYRWLILVLIIVIIGLIIKAFI